MVRQYGEDDQLPRVVHSSTGSRAYYVYILEVRVGKITISTAHAQHDPVDRGSSPVLFMRMVIIGLIITRDRHRIL